MAFYTNVEFVQEKKSTKVEKILPGTFGHRLTTAFGTTEIAEIARQMGATYQQIKNYVVEGRLPKAEVLLQIRGLTNVDLDWLLTGESKPQISEKKAGFVTPGNEPSTAEEKPERLLKVFISYFHNLPDAQKAAMATSFVETIFTYTLPKESKKSDPIIEQNNFLMADPEGRNAGTKHLPKAIRKDIADARAAVEKAKKQRD